MSPHGLSCKPPAVFVQGGLEHCECRFPSSPVTPLVEVLEQSSLGLPRSPVLKTSLGHLAACSRFVSLLARLPVQPGRGSCDVLTPVVLQLQGLSER